MTSGSRTDGSGDRAALAVASVSGTVLGGLLLQLISGRNSTGAGMGEGPSLALLLAGPALSLPNMPAIRSIMGAERTLVDVPLVVVMATLSGLICGAIVVSGKGPVEIAAQLPKSRGLPPSCHRSVTTWR